MGMNNIFENIKSKIYLFNKRSLIIIGIALILSIIAIIYLVFTNLQSNSPNQVKQEEVLKLVKEIGKLMELPKGENPTLATVIDINKLKNQAFFAKAKNGDKVLIYENAKLAILYDSVSHKILNVAPVNSPSPSPIPEIKVAIFNGTTVSRLTYKVEESWKSTYPEVKVVSRDNTQKDGYEKTIVVVLNKSSDEFAKVLSKLLNATISSLPEGEKAPSGADILIIAGKDSI